MRLFPLLGRAYRLPPIAVRIRSSVVGVDKSNELSSPSEETLDRMLSSNATLETRGKRLAVS